MADASPKDLKPGFIKLLERLEQLMRAKGEPFRANAYKKAQEELLGSTTPISSADQLKHRPGIGATMLKKFEEYARTGKLGALGKPEDQALLDLTAVHGIGPKKAKQLIQQGIQTIDQLRTAAAADPKLLNSKQRAALAVHEDLQERIPRQEIQAYEKRLVEVWDSVVPAGQPGDQMMIVGSYRRGTADSGDIDVIITSGKDDPTLHKRFVDALKKANLFTAILSTGKTKTLAIAKLGPEMLHRRVDIMYSNPTEFPFAVLYFTGSRSFNVAMRNRALGLGYSLSEHGLIETATKNKVLQPMKTEEDIFRFLGMRFKQPQERTGVLAVEAAEGAAPVRRQLIKTKKAAASKRGKKTVATPPATPRVKTPTPAAPEPTPHHPSPLADPAALTHGTAPPETPGVKTPIPASTHGAVPPETPGVKTPIPASTHGTAPPETLRANISTPTPKKTQTPKKKTIRLKLVPSPSEPVRPTPKPRKPRTPKTIVPTPRPRPAHTFRKRTPPQPTPRPTPRPRPTKKVSPKAVVTARTSPTERPPDPTPIMIASAPHLPSVPIELTTPEVVNTLAANKTPEFVRQASHSELSERLAVAGSPTPHVTPKNRKKQEAEYTEMLASTLAQKLDTSGPQSLKLTPKSITKKTVQKAKRPTMKANLANYSLQGSAALLQMDRKALEMMYRKANKTYREGAPIMTDTAFDILEDHIKERFPDSNVLKVIGAKTKRVEVPLPYTLFSMNKVKPGQGKLDAWKSKYRGPYVISAKLDGASALYVLKKDGAGLYTHGEVRKGDTTQKGGDVTHLVPLIGMATELPPGLPETIMVRGEVILNRHLFESKYSDDYANPRNLAAGLLNAMDTAKHGDRQKDLKFVAFEVIEPKGLTPTEQFAFLKQHQPQLGPGLKVVWHEQIAKPEELTEERLSEVFQWLRSEHDYECDGVIVVDDKVYPRKNQNPDHALAFKMTLADQKVEATVRTISWNVSKDGYIKPTVHVHPVKVPGATLSKATGHDARALQRKKIGPGAKVELLRRGDVIPHVERVLTPATDEAMQEGWWEGPYEWDGANIRLPAEAKKDDQWNTEVRLTNMQRFFKMIKAKGLGPKVAAKLFEEGYDTISKVAAATPQELTRIDGIQATSAQKIVDSVRKALAEAPLIKLVVGSNIFGRGTGHTIMGDALTKYPHLLHFASDDPADVRLLEVGLAGIKGISPARAQQIIAAIPEFRHFMEHMRLDLVKPWPTARALAPPDPVAAKGPSPVLKGHPLSGRQVVTTGIKHKLIEPHLDRAGAKLGERVTKDTAAVVVRDDPLYESGKTKDAAKHGVPTMTVEQFLGKFFPGA